MRGGRRFEGPLKFKGSSIDLVFFLPQTLKFSFEGSWGLAEVALSKRQYSLSYLNQGD